MDAQKSLQSVDVYTGFALDGWFHDKMKDAVALFQEWAEKGQFLINDVLTDTGEKLTGHRKGVLCPKTQEHLQKVADKGGKVADYSLYVQFSTSLDSGRQKLLSKMSINVLGEAAMRLGYQHITITSTIRYPIQQAEAMYTNLSNGKRLNYAAPGMAVTSVYDDCKKKGTDKETTISQMVDKINSLSQEGLRVSKHCVSVEEYCTMNIVDISVPTAEVQKFLTELAKSNNVVKIFHDIDDIENTNKIARLAKEPCIHVEIKQ